MGLKKVLEQAIDEAVVVGAVGGLLALAAFLISAGLDNDQHTLAPSVFAVIGSLGLLVAAAAIGAVLVTRALGKALVALQDELRGGPLVAEPVALSEDAF